MKEELKSIKDDLVMMAEVNPFMELWRGDQSVFHGIIPLVRNEVSVAHRGGFLLCHREAFERPILVELENS